ncbi:MAG: family 10 glycosylhydrolase [Cyanobacteria bacterium J06643_4]
MRSLFSSLQRHLQRQLTIWLQTLSVLNRRLSRGRTLTNNWTIGLAALCLLLLGLNSVLPSGELSPQVAAPLQSGTSLSLKASAQPRLSDPPNEIRGVWITNVASSVFFAPWGIPRAIHQLADMRFNTLYPVVWNRGQTFYHSETLEKITGRAIAPMMVLAHPTEDPLQEMLRFGHREHMRVIPWFEYGFMVPMRSRLARAHSDWLTTRYGGSPLLHEPVHEPVHEPALAASNQPPRGFFSRFLNSGAPKELGWLNPLHPEVQALILAMVEEVVTHYDVDGIQFDDHFSLPAAFGYDDYTVGLYQAEHGGQLPPENQDDADWIRWRADKFSQFVDALHSRVKQACPTCIVSLSPNPAKFAYRFHLQDWQKWLDNGWLDELVVQVYRDDFYQFEGELAKKTLQSAMDRVPVSIGILTGTWRRPISFEQIREQVISSRDHHFSGVSFFYWDTLWSYFTPESPQQRRQQFRALMGEHV